VGAGGEDDFGPGANDLMMMVEPQPTVMAISGVSVRDVMSPGVIAVPSDTTVRACAETMSERHTHAVLVIDQRTREPMGWVTHLDVLHYLRSDPMTTLAGGVVSQEAAYIDGDATVEEAAERMIRDEATHLLVGSPSVIPEGVLSSWDLVAHYARPGRRGA
jgi:CBS domain-containing protein